MNTPNDRATHGRSERRHGGLSASYLRSVLLHAAEEGRLWALRHPEILGKAGRAPDELELTGSAAESLQELVESIRYAAEVQVADEIDAETAYWVELAIEAAVVRGAGVAGDTSNRPACGEDGTAAVADELLTRVVRKLIGVGCSLAGARPYIDAAQAAEFAAVGIASNDPVSEVRTAWIKDHGTGTPYQWRLERVDSEIHMSRRSRGERRFSPALSIHAGEAGLLSALLRRFE